MTPDPRTEEIRAHYAYPYVATSPGEHDRVAYLLDRNKALEDVADKARELVVRIESEGGHGYTVHDLAATTRAALDALDGQS